MVLVGVTSGVGCAEIVDVGVLDGVVVVEVVGVSEVCTLGAGLTEPVGAGLSEPPHELNTQATATRANNGKYFFTS